MKHKTRWLQHNRNVQLNALPTSFPTYQCTRSNFPQIYTNTASPNSLSALSHTRQCHRWWFFPFHEKIHIVKGLTESPVEPGEVFPLTTVSLESSLSWLWNIHKILGHTWICTLICSIFVFYYYKTISLHIFAVPLWEDDVSASDGSDWGRRYVRSYSNTRKIVIHTFFQIFYHRIISIYLPPMIENPLYSEIKGRICQYEN